MLNAIHTKIATPGPGYQATSSTSATLANSGTVTLTTQAGLAYSAGARVRVTYTADVSKWMEGIVSSYSGTTLAFTADTSNGSGTFASWSINLAGQPGAATAVSVGTTTTGAAGSSASVSNSGTSYAPVLNFTIPRGDTGANASAANWRGAYASGTTYAQGDGVTYSGVAYISLQASNTGHQPDTNPSWWQNVGSTGLGDPGSNGIVKRTGANVTAVAVAGTDYLAPSTEAWNALTLNNGWTHIGAPYESPQYLRIPLPQGGYLIILKGVIVPGTTANGTTIATLPSGARPSEELIRIAVTGNTAGSTCRLDITSSGAILMYGYGGGSFISLGNLVFSTL